MDVKLQSRREVMKLSSNVGHDPFLEDLSGTACKNGSYCLPPFMFLMFCESLSTLLGEEYDLN